MTRSQNKTWLGFGAVVVAGAGLFAYQHFSQARGKQDLKFETAVVDRGPLVSKITATGTLSALVTVQVGSQVSGRLQEILVDFNDTVKKGQVIAKIDPQLFKAALEQGRANAVAAQANLERAQVQALEAERQHARINSLAEQKLVSAAEADTAQASAQSAAAQVAAARAAVQQAQASLHQTQVNLEYTTIVSPIDGVVISRNVDVGQTVAASLQAPTLFVIAEDLRKMQVDASVSEADVGKLRSGMGASFTVDAFPGERFTGSVRQIRNAPQTLQNVVTYNCVIDVANPELKLRPGMTASVTFVHAQRDDVLRIANAALRFRPTPELLSRLRQQKAGASVSAQARPAPPEDGRRTVWVLRSGRPEPVAVRTGLSDGSLTEVLDGPLRSGDSLVIDAPDFGSGPGRGGGRGPFRMF